MVLTDEYSPGQGEFCTKARYSHVPEEDGTSEYVVDVFVILPHEPPSTLFSHLTTAPLCPERVIVPVVTPGQRGEVPPAIDPPADGETTVIDLESE
jgi:hypothetical protein